MDGELFTGYGLLSICRLNTALLIAVQQELKSSKILIDPTGICKIGGLGCSQTELRDNSRAVPCDIFWTAPEIIRTQYKAYDGKADIWSIGCIVLEMLTGKRPWYDNEAVAVMFKVNNHFDPDVSSHR